MSSKSIQERIHDISPLLSPRIGVFPGDRAFRRQLAFGYDSGHRFELSSIETTLHLGAHADAPRHYHPEGRSIDRVPLDLYIGLCQVVTPQGVPPGGRVKPESLHAHFADRRVLAPRVLIRTLSFPDAENWNSDFQSLSPELIDWLAERGVRLVGIDTPSIDPEQDAELSAHAAVFRRGLHVLEGLVMEGVDDGVYELIALPLRLEGCEASPVRAILRGIEENGV